MKALSKYCNKTHSSKSPLKKVNFLETDTNSSVLPSLTQLLKLTFNFALGLFGGVLIPVKSNSELILYGGGISSGPTSGVWKFRSQTQSWSKVGSLQRQRQVFAGIVAPNLECQ